MDFICICSGTKLQEKKVCISNRKKSACGHFLDVYLDTQIVHAPLLCSRWHRTHCIRFIYFDFSLSLSLSCINANFYKLFESSYQGQLDFGILKVIKSSPYPKWWCDLHISPQNRCYPIMVLLLLLMMKQIGMFSKHCLPFACVHWLFGWLPWLPSKFIQIWP